MSPAGPNGYGQIAVNRIICRVTIVTTIHTPFCFPWGLADPNG